METTLYADVLFLINFSMDYLSLWLCGRIFQIKMKTWRVAVSASVGAVWGIAAVILGLRGASELLLTVAVGFIMTRISFKWEGMSRYLSMSLTLWGVGMLFGGIMTAILSLGGKSTLAGIGGGSPYAVIPAGVILAVCFIRIIGRHVSERNTQVTVRIAGRSVTAQALSDSGNLLRDPVSGRAVMIIGQRDAVTLLGRRTASLLADGIGDNIGLLPDDIRRRIRLIPAHSVTGTVMMTGFVPDEVTLVHGRRSVTRDYIVAVRKGTGDSTDERIIVPSDFA